MLNVNDKFMCLGWFFDFDEKSGVVPGLLLFSDFLDLNYLIQVSVWYKYGRRADFFATG